MLPHLVLYTRRWRLSSRVEQLMGSSNKVHCQSSCHRQHYPTAILGDLLLTLNGQSLCQLTHKEVGEWLTSSPPLVEMTIFRRTLSQGFTFVTASSPMLPNLFPAHSTDGEVTPAPPPVAERRQQTAVTMEQTAAHPPLPLAEVLFAPHEKKPPDHDNVDELKEASSHQDAEKNSAQKHPERECSTEEVTTANTSHLEGVPHSEGGKEEPHEPSIDETLYGGTAMESSPGTQPHLTSTTTLENKSMEETASSLVPLASTVCTLLMKHYQVSTCLLLYCRNYRQYASEEREVALGLPSRYTHTHTHTHTHAQSDIPVTGNPEEPLSSCESEHVDPRRLSGGVRTMQGRLYHCCEW